MVHSDRYRNLGGKVPGPKRIPWLADKVMLDACLEKYKRFKDEFDQGPPMKGPAKQKPSEPAARWAGADDADSGSSNGGESTSEEETDQDRGMKDKIAELKAQLKKAEGEAVEHKRRKKANKPKSDPTVRSVKKDKKRKKRDPASAGAGAGAGEAVDKKAKKKKKKREESSDEKKTKKKKKRARKSLKSHLKGVKREVTWRSPVNPQAKKEAACFSRGKRPTRVRVAAKETEALLEVVHPSSLAMVIRQRRRIQFFAKAPPLPRKAVNRGCCAARGNTPEDWHPACY